MNSLHEKENPENTNISQARVFSENWTNIDNKDDLGNENENINSLKPITKDPQSIEDSSKSIEETEEIEASKNNINEDWTVDMDSETNLPDPNYMIKVQDDISEKMRAILIDWLVDVHLQLLIVPETLYLAVNLIDRYLSHVTIPREQFQLVGATAMMIASKYEDIYPPNVEDYEYLTERAYTVEEILDLEEKMLEYFGSKVTMTTSYGFLKRFARICRLNKKSFNLARYLLELALIEYKIVKYVPRNLACSAIYLVNKLEKRANAWPEEMRKRTSYKEIELKAAAKDLCLLLQDAGKDPLLQAVKIKFSSPKFNEVGEIQWT